MIVSAVLALAVHAIQAPKMSPIPKPVRVAAVCFKTGEKMSGMNRICYYNCMGSEAAITVGSAELCPLTIDR